MTKFYVHYLYNLQTQKLQLPQVIVGSYNGRIWNSPDHFVMQSQGQAARLYSVQFECSLLQ